MTSKSSDEYKSLPPFRVIILPIVAVVTNGHQLQKLSFW